MLPAMRKEIKTRRKSTLYRPAVINLNVKFFNPLGKIKIGVIINKIVEPEKN